MNGQLQHKYGLVFVAISQNCFVKKPNVSVWTRPQMVVQGRTADFKGGLPHGGAVESNQV